MRTETEEVEKMLAQWDAGETIWSISLGGLGLSSYEQAIQIAAVEFARAANDLPDTREEEVDKKAFEESCDVVEQRCTASWGWITGSMSSVARWLAWHWCFAGGPEALIQRARRDGKEDRIIQVSKRWPGT